MQRTATYLVTLVFVIQAAFGMAETADRQKTDALYQALGLPQLLEIMRIEGLEHGDAVADQVFAERTNSEWDMIVSDIYAPAFMAQDMRAAFDEELLGCDIDAMLSFFQSQTGQKIVGLEISARRALLDSSVDSSSKEAAAWAQESQSPRFSMIRDFIDANRLIDRNVAGALNASYAFRMGLMEGGALPRNVTADSILQDVWAQESDIRKNTSEWLYSYLLLAFAPLSDEELAAYLAFSTTEAGQDLTAALVMSFDGLFSDISRALGLASARFLTSYEL